MSKNKIINNYHSVSFNETVVMSLTSLFGILIAGIIFSLIVSIFLKREEPQQLTTE
jgi:hypothetical protein